ncbi:MAG: hypothetical protein GF310_08955 [candidate division Zixibacteria bacterium]|nr:hypothetical protein [candidate division Zixibacteria bacterium]
MKIIIILIGLLLLSGIAMAANDVEVHVNWPADTVFIGSYNQLQIWMENDVDLLGYAMGFEFSGYTGTIIWDMNYGDEPPGNVENDARGAIHQNFVPHGFEDNILPDSILIGGAMVPPAYTGLPVNNSRLCYTLRFYIPDDASEETFCIDNVFIPPAGDWIFDDGAQSIIPDYHGCQNSGPQDPDCPAVCYPVRTTTRLCGDVNGDGTANLSDIVFILDYLFHGFSGADFFRWVVCDVTCNGRVNIADVGYFIEYIFMGGNPPCYNCP